MTAQQVIDAIHSARYTGLKNGLDNTQALLNKLSIAPDTVPAIHVAGTNGKGSVCAMAESGLRYAGLKTGLYTSPFLQRYNERIAINGVPINDEMLSFYGTRVLDAAKDIGATAFELGTALALLVFKEEKVDVAVIEVGLGGRLDPTNVIKPKLCVITAIGMDHMAILGDTIEEIAEEKAGIIKENVPVILQPCDDNIKSVIALKAKKMQARLICPQTCDIRDASSDKYGTYANVMGIEMHIPLAGEHQVMNALTAATLLQQWGVSDKAIAKGIASTVWPARLEWHEHILIDGAHNMQGIMALKAYTQKFLSFDSSILILGMMADKLTHNMLDVLRSLASRIITVSPENERAMSAKELATLIGNAQAAESVQNAIALAKEMAREKDHIIIAGSLYLAGEVRAILGLKPR